MEVTKVLMVAHEIVETYGSHVMLVHHTNKQGSFNGTQSFKNHVDTQIELQRADKNAPIIMHNEKQRDGADLFPDIRHGSNGLDSLNSLNKSKFILKPLSKPFRNEFLATGIVQTVKQDVPILNLA
jgi:predicted ATP-dependent serine protease